MFKIVKNDQLPGGLIAQCPELAKLERSLALTGKTKPKETVSMKINDLIKASGGVTDVPVRKSNRSAAEVTEIVKVRRRKAALNARLERLWERPDANGASNLEVHILEEIEKADLELAALQYEAPDQFAETSAFFFRGGSSVNSPITDSAFENVNSLGVAKQADVRKAEQMIDLNPNPMGTQTDYSDISKIDLKGVKL